MSVEGIKYFLQAGRELLEDLVQDDNILCLFSREKTGSIVQVTGRASLRRLLL